MKYYLTLIFGLLSLFGANAQFSQKEAFDLAGGYIENGYSGKFGYNRSIGQKGSIRLNGQVNFEVFENMQFDDIKLNVYLVNAEYYYRIFDINSSDILISIGAGGAAGYEDLLNDSKLDNGQELAEKSNVIYGGHIGVEIDKYLFQVSPSGNSISLFAQARQYYFTQTDFGANQFNAMLGFRFNF